MPSGPRKAILPQENLPDLTVFKDGTFGYRVRYRIISEDQNRFSHYSPIYTVRPSFIFERPNGRAEDSIAINTSPLYLEAVWEQVDVKDRETKTLIRKATGYDVWVRWDQAETAPDPVGVWQFENSLEGKKEAFTIPSSYALSDGTVVEEAPTHISIEVYVRATTPTRDSDALLVYKRDNFVF